MSSGRRGGLRHTEAACVENNASCVQELPEPSESDLEHVQTRTCGPLTFRVTGPALSHSPSRAAAPAEDRVSRPARLPHPCHGPASAVLSRRPPAPGAVTRTPLTGQTEMSSQEGTWPAGVKTIKSLLKVIPSRKSFTMNCSFVFTLPEPFSKKGDKFFPFCCFWPVGGSHSPHSLSFCFHARRAFDTRTCTELLGSRG